jgi:hypothetical protein
MIEYPFDDYVLLLSDMRQAMIRLGVPGCFKAGR